MIKTILFSLFALHSSLSPAQTLRTNISAHDPVMIKQDSTYYVFCTGRGISMWSSKDRVNWLQEKSVFDSGPRWAMDSIPAFKGHIWAPDISYANGLYYLYYSVSAFGKNTSAIGVTTNKTLNPRDAAYRWTDHGKVIQSIPNQTNWNAIDPNLITDEKGNPYLSFGSFWEGLKLVKLTKDRLNIAENINKLPTIASHIKIDKSAGNPPSVDDNPKDAGGNAIEAPFIFKRGKYYYLFASTDYCCKGVKSTYKMIVGRAKKVTGPYIDKDNMPMANGGGNLLLQGDSSWYGVGHNAVCTFEEDYLIFHGYSAADNGRSKLRIERLAWKEEWPVVMLKP